MQDIKVMSFNIRNSRDDGTEGPKSWKERSKRLIPLVRSEAPDLIGFQEVLHDQYMDLVNNLHEYSYAGVGREDGVNGGEYTAIFFKKDRFRLMESGNFWLSETPDRPSLGWDAACTRICTYVKLADVNTGKEFFHFNTHLDHQGKAAQTQGARLIRDTMVNKKSPAFVTGDFNVQEQSEVYNIMTRQGLRDAKYSAKSTMSFGTFNGYNLNDNLQKESPIDYMFYTSGDFQVEKYQVIVNGKDGEFASDHYPILIKLVL